MVGYSGPEPFSRETGMLHHNALPELGPRLVFFYETPQPLDAYSLSRFTFLVLEKNFQLQVLFICNLQRCRAWGLGGCHRDYDQLTSTLNVGFNIHIVYLLFFAKNGYLPAFEDHIRCCRFVLDM